jgi:DNA-binding response OmpR family regulator
MIELVIACFIGIAIGTTTGMIPGIHVNTAGAILFASSTFLLSQEHGEEGSLNPLKSELGIILMRDNIVAHHGEIKIEQDTETGTSISVYIPMGKKHFENNPNVTFVDAEKVEIVEIESTAEKDKQILQEDETMIVATASNSKHKMLIIEDHKDIRLYMKVVFSQHYTIIMAENGEEGVRLARKEIPDIIISDVMMPGMDGFECTKILKEDIKTCHIPIILLTALVGDSNMVKDLELGADDYILKPFNPEILISKVKRLIKNRLELKQTYMKLMMANSKLNATRQEEEPKEDPFIRRIFDIVEENLQNPDFNVKRLAEMLNMSQPTLYRRVKMLTNYTIIELTRGVRLRRAAELLRTRKYSIQEVSEMVGYNDSPTFRKHFVDFYGTTPSAYAHKENVE